MRAGHLLGIQPHMYKHKNHKHLHIVHVDGKNMIPSGTRRHLLTCIQKTIPELPCKLRQALIFLLILRQFVHAWNKIYDSPLGLAPIPPNYLHNSKSTWESPE